MRSNIEIERARLQKSKAQMAEALGITPRTYYSYINDGVIPSDVLEKLADMTGMTTDYLLNRASA